MPQETLHRKMFLILHDPFTGRAGVDVEPMKYGLVAAALAHLVLQRRLGVEDGRVLLVDRHGIRTDDVSDLIVGSLHGRPGADITRSWVDSLTDMVYELVARGLMADGVIRRERGRRVLRRNPDRFPAVDLLRAAGPRIRLEHVLRAPHDMDVVGALLAGIVHAFHLDPVLDTDRDRAAMKRALATAVHHLPADLRSLVVGVMAAVASPALDFRRL